MRSLMARFLQLLFVVPKSVTTFVIGWLIEAILYVIIDPARSYMYPSNKVGMKGRDENGVQIR